jgi:hypothetical protein
LRPKIIEDSGFFLLGDLVLNKEFKKDEQFNDIDEIVYLISDDKNLFTSKPLDYELLWSSKNSTPNSIEGINNLIRRYKYSETYSKR